MKTKEEIIEEIEVIIKQTIKDLIIRYGDDDNGIGFVRIDGDDLFENDGGVSINTASEEITSALDKLLSQQKQDIVEEIENQFPGNSLETGRNCELICDHNPVWDGNYYTCENCGTQFVSIKRFKNYLDQFKQKLTK